MGSSYPAGSYDTKLPGPAEQAFQQWKSKLPKNLQGESDYDLRGAFLANAQQAANGHMGDQFKKPNHMTFSDESQYSRPDAPGGHWGDAGGGKFNFWASPENVAQHGITDLTNYFNQYEPDSTVIFPSRFSLPKKGTR